MNDSPRLLPVRPSLSLETALYLVLFLAALAVRLLHLGAHPLNDAEAREALGALAQLRGGGPDVLAGAHSPAYFFFTYLSFFLFDASDASARLGPALAGAALVLVPALFREALGRATALVMSALLVVSATLLAASRSADGTMFAVLALGLTLGALWRYARGGHKLWFYVGAVALGLGLASGGDFLLGVLALVLVAVIWRFTGPDRGEALRGLAARALSERRAFLITAALSAVIIATVGLLALRGLGALFDSWLAALAAFAPGAPGGRQPLEVLLFLVVYEPLLLVFGLMGAWRAFRTGNALGQGLAWFSLVALTLVVVYSGRQVADVVWVALPLAALAAWALTGLLHDIWTPAEWPLAAAQAGLSAALLGFALLNLAGLAESSRLSPAGFAAINVPIFGQVSSLAQLGVAFLAVTLTFVIAYLLALGWSAVAARLGLVLAGGGILLAMTVGAAWGVTQLRPGSPAELWWAEPASPDVRRMLTTLGDVSDYAVGNAHDIEVTVQADRNGLLAWALRDFPHANFVDRLDPVITSPVVIAPDVTPTNPTLGSTYVGQGFDLRSTWTLDLSQPEWFTWLAFRTAARQVNEPVVLWVRQDVQQLQSSGGTGN